MGIWTPAELAELRRLVAADLTDKAIARRIGRTIKAVTRRRELLGLRKHGRVRRRVLRLLAAGYTVAGVALMVNRAESHVREIRRRAAVTRAYDAKAREVFGEFASTNFKD